MAHEHSIIDADRHFVIDPVTRKIANESGKLVIMQHDHNSERLTFELPNLVDGHDMSLCNVAQIHYINLEAATGVTYSDVYDADDLQVETGETGKVTCSWLISNNATQYAGKLVFVVLFKCTDDDGNLLYQWSTDKYEDIVITDGIYNSDVVIAQYSDIMEQWRQTLVLANIVTQYTPAEARAELGIDSLEIQDGAVSASKIDQLSGIIVNAKKTTAALPVAGWSNMQQTVVVSGVTAANDILVSCAPASTEAWGKAGVYASAQSTNSVTFTCTKVPTEELTANIMILNGVLS